MKKWVSLLEGRLTINRDSSNTIHDIRDVAKMGCED